MKSHRLFVPQSMIPAMLSGAKTQHRVPIPRVDKRAKGWDIKLGACFFYNRPNRKGKHNGGMLAGEPVRVFAEPGEEVWVPEAWQAVHFTDDDWWHCEGPVPKPIIENPETPHPPFWAIVYQQDPEPDWPEHIDDRGFPWRSPATMPRWAARIVRTVKAVRVERVQDISEADAAAEGVRPSWLDASGGYINFGPPSFRSGYSFEWNNTHSPGAWDRNDWVWVLDLEAKR